MISFSTSSIHRMLVAIVQALDLSTARSHLRSYATHIHVHMSTIMAKMLTLEIMAKMLTLDYIKYTTYPLSFSNLPPYCRYYCPLACFSTHCHTTTPQHLTPLHLTVTPLSLPPFQTSPS